MTDRPIIFSAPMVRALLAGRKTMTRRVLKPQPEAYENAYCRRLRFFDCKGRLLGDASPEGDAHVFAPYAIGDRLWVRESLYRDRMENFLTGERTTNSEVSYYTADNAEAVDRLGFNLAWKWKRGKLSARYCPMEFARPWRLVVTAVRVERLQEITDADALKEGIGPFANSQTIDCETESPRRVFSQLWDSLHGPGAWDANPWVAVISFETEAHP